MRVPVRQMNGKVILLEVTSCATVRELKRQLRGWQPCEDELTRQMTTVDLVLGEEKLLDNDATIEEAGISATTSALQVLYSINPVQCSRQESSEVDEEDLLVVSIPELSTCITECAFFRCSFLVKVLIPESVTEIDDSAFEECASLILDWWTL